MLCAVAKPAARDVVPTYNCRPAARLTAPGDPFIHVPSPSPPGSRGRDATRPSALSPTRGSATRARAAARAAAL
eukprot:6955428-Prymnesium_polylepis.1